MPTNLNALIRYKTINSCLYGGRRWTISDLIESCSNALAEARGRYEGISERTIRDDIRVMRSDILGFNAPILQKDGLYYFSDPFYSIMTISFTDSGLIDQIITLLQELRSQNQHPELESVLERLFALTETRAIKVKKFKLWPKKIDDTEFASEPSPEAPEIEGTIKDMKNRLRFRRVSQTKDEEESPKYIRREKLLVWEDIFKVMTKTL